MLQFSDDEFSRFGNIFCYVYHVADEKIIYIIKVMQILFFIFIANLIFDREW